MGAGVPDVYGLAVWGHAGLIHLMFGLAWLAAVGKFASLRRPLRGVALFNLATGASLVLIAARDQWPFALTHTLANLLQVVAYVLLWRATELLMGLVPAVREQWLVGVLGSVLVLALGLSPVYEQQGVAAALVAEAWVSLRIGLRVAQRLRRRADWGTALVVLGLMTVVVGALLARAVAGLVTVPGAGDVNVEFAVSARLSWVFLLAGFTTNVVLAYVTFGRMVLEVERLSARDPVTGLADQGTVVRALDYECRQASRRHRPPALLLLSLDDLARPGAGWGGATEDAVLAEVALLVQSRLRAGDLLGHGGRGRFLVLLPDASRQSARRLAQALLSTMALDRGLHPDGDQALAVSAGLALGGPADDGATLLARAGAMCQLSRRAGGRQVVDDSGPPDALPAGSRAA